MVMRTLFHVDRVGGLNVGFQHETVPARNRRVERLAEADTDASRQELVEDLRWLFLSEALETAVKETSSLVGQDDGTAKVSADGHFVLGRVG